MRCRRCVGKGELRIRFGKPGQDTRISGALVEEGPGWKRYEGGGYTFAHIEWEDKVTVVDCPVCLGFGNEADKPNKQAGKKVRIYDNET